MSEIIPSSHPVFPQLCRELVGPSPTWKNIVSFLMWTSSDFNLEITDPGFLTQAPKQDVSYFPVIAFGLGASCDM